MQRILLVLLWLTLGLVATPRHAQAQAQDDVTPAAPTAWSTPATLYPEAWPAPRHTSFSNDGARLVALVPNSGSDDNSRHIVFSEAKNGVWQTPTVIAQNGAYADAGFQVLPQRTHPVISGDGKTIAYVGYTGTTYGLYVLNRVADGTWSAPALVNTGFANTHYWIGLSRTGATLAVSDYPFLGVQHLYVLTRTNGAWSAPMRVSLDSGPNQGGGMPSLSEDGSRLVFIANAQVMYSQRTADGWTAPIAITGHDTQTIMAEFPQLSGDGMCIVYWLVTLTPNGSGQVRTAQNLYNVWWERDAWGAPRLVNPTPVLPSSATEGPATLSRAATRIVYTRPVTTTDSISGESTVTGSHLDVSEWIGGAWQTTRLVEMTGYGNFNQWPRLTPVGRTLTFDGWQRATGALPVNALWRLTTADSPTIPPHAFSLTALLSTVGSTLLSSPFDNTRYQFDPGAFTTTVTMTHSFWTDPPAPPDGFTGIGGIGGIGGLGGSFLTTLLGRGGLPIQPTRPVTITVDYSDTDTGTTIPGSLSVWWRNADAWVRLPSIDDPAIGQVMAPVSHFSHFAIFGETNRLYLPHIAR